MNEFWEDIRLVEDGESEALFLGAIMLKYENASDPSAGILEEFLVLGGQQRIATLFMTILAVALEWQEHGHQDAAISVTQNFLMSTRAATNGQPRFVPTIPDRPEFYALCRELKTTWQMSAGGKVEPGKMTACLKRSRSEVRSRCNAEDSFSVTSEAIQLYGDHWRPYELSFADEKQIENYYHPFALTVDDTATVAGSFRA